MVYETTLLYWRSLGIFSVFLRGWVGGQLLGFLKYGHPIWTWCKCASKFAGLLLGTKTYKSTASKTWPFNQLLIKQPLKDGIRNKKIETPPILHFEMSFHQHWGWLRAHAPEQRAVKCLNRKKKKEREQRQQGHKWEIGGFPLSHTVGDNQLSSHGAGQCQRAVCFLQHRAVSFDWKAT